MSIAFFNANIWAWTHNFHHIGHVSCKVKNEIQKLNVKAVNKDLLFILPYGDILETSLHLHKGRTKFLALLQMMVSPKRKGKMLLVCKLLMLDIKTNVSCWSLTKTERLLHVLFLHLDLYKHKNFIVLFLWTTRD